MENFDLVQVDEEDENKFYSGDAYVVLYAFNNGTRDSYMIYYWLVSESKDNLRWNSMKNFIIKQ